MPVGAVQQAANRGVPAAHGTSHAAPAPLSPGLERWEGRRGPAPRITLKTGGIAALPIARNGDVALIHLLIDATETPPGRNRAGGRQAQGRKSIMSNDSKPETTMTIEKLRNGKWAFVLKRGTVVYPAHGQFTSQLQAHAAGQAALKALENNR
jgi:hypothetical protein